MKLALGNGRWCATKNENESQVTIMNGHCEYDLNCPIISGYGDLNQEIDFNASYTLPNVSATDKDGNKLNVTTIIKQGDKVVDKIDTSKVGSYTITYTTEPDKEGDISSVTVTIQVIKKETEIDKIIESGTQDGELDLIDNTYYYRGSSPKNWVQFDGVTGRDSLWRIISIEKGIMKLIRSTGVISMEWDTANSNDWTRPSSVNTYLNETYYNTLSDKLQNYIQDSTFYIGSVSEGNSANDNAEMIREKERLKEWNGKVGLINLSDYAYASREQSCLDIVLNNRLCKNSWLYQNQYEWTMNANAEAPYLVYYLDTSGHLNGFSNVINRHVIRPVVFLKSDIKIASGNGSQELPFIIQSGN